MLGIYVRVVTDMLGMHWLVYAKIMMNDKDTATKIVVGMSIPERRPEEAEPPSMIQPIRKSSTRFNRLFGCADAKSRVASFPQPL